MERLSKLVPNYEKILDGEHVGDIEEFKVFREVDGDKSFYAIGIEGVLAGFFSIDTKPEVVLQTVWVDPKWRRLFSAILLFLKRVEGHDRFFLGDLHSADTMEAIKRVTRATNVYWVRDGEIVPYDATKIDNFYTEPRSTPDNGWRIMIEHLVPNIHPKFYSSKLDEFHISMLYFNLIEDL